MINTMSNEDKDYIKKLCKKDALKLVDALFDNELLNPKLKRKDLRVIEELIVLNTYYAITSHIKWKALLDSINQTK